MMACGRYVWANSTGNDLFQILIFTDDITCVDAETLENIRVDNENFPVEFLVAPLASDGTSEISAMTIRQKVEALQVDAGLWFSCGKGMVHLTAHVGSFWLDQQRVLQIDSGQLNAEGICAVIHGWLDALIQTWQKENVTTNHAPGVNTPSLPTSSDSPPSKGSDTERARDVERPSAAKRKQRQSVSLEFSVMDVIVRPSINSVGGVLFLGIRPKRSPFELYAKVGFLRSLRFRETPLSLKVRQYPLGLGGRWTTGFHVGYLETGVELEGTALPYITRAGSVIIQEGFLFQLSVVPMVGVTFRMAKWGFFAFRLGMRVALGRPVFEARIDGGLHQMHVTPVLQPLGYVGLGFEFL